MTDRTAARDRVLESHLRRLDGDACAALVTDLWAARGYETAHEDGVVVATRGDRSVTIYPVASTRFGSVPAPDRPVDVVVAPDGGDGAAALAASEGARLLDAAALRELLLYGLDRSTAVALCESHLGAAPGDLRPPLRARVRERAGAVEGPAVEVPASAGAVATALLLVACVGLVAGVGYSAISGGGAGPITGDVTARGAAPIGEAAEVIVGPEATDAGTVTPMATATPDEAATPTTDSVPVPGVTREGITNLTTLGVAHRRAVGTRSHTLWIDVYRPRGGQPNATRVQRDVDVAVAAGRYRLTATVEESRQRRIVREVYHDGIDWYVANVTGDESSYRRVSVEGRVQTAGDGRTSALGPSPFELRRTLVTRYLATPETAFDRRTTEEGRTVYRVSGSGVPPAFEGVRNYSAVALVDDTGLVRSLVVEYTVVRPNGTYRQRFEVTYDRLDRTTVEPPAWYRRLFVGNGTRTAAEASLGGGGNVSQ